LLELLRFDCQQSFSKDFMCLRIIDAEFGGFSAQVSIFLYYYIWGKILKVDENLAEY
jgi:hypothetical protein